MKCEKCGGKLLLRHTDEKNRIIRRCRVCSECGEKLITFELPEKTLIERFGELDKKSRGKVAPETLCWECYNSLGFCSWSSRNEPVSGWVAEPTVIENEGVSVRSYRVIVCPQFIKERRML
jgi:hypothetical protein